MMSGSRPFPGSMKSERTMPCLVRRSSEPQLPGAVAAGRVGHRRHRELLLHLWGMWPLREGLKERARASGARASTRPKVGASTKARAPGGSQEEVVEQVECQTCWPEASWSRPRKLAGRAHLARWPKSSPWDSVHLIAMDARMLQPFQSFGRGLRHR